MRFLRCKPGNSCDNKSRICFLFDAIRVEYIKNEYWIIAYNAMQHLLSIIEMRAMIGIEVIHQKIQDIGIGQNDRLILYPIARDSMKHLSMRTRSHSLLPDIQLNAIYSDNPIDSTIDQATLLIANKLISGIDSNGGSWWM